MTQPTAETKWKFLKNVTLLFFTLIMVRVVSSIEF